MSLSPLRDGRPKSNRPTVPRVTLPHHVSDEVGKVRQAVVVSRVIHGMLRIARVPTEERGIPGLAASFPSPQYVVHPTCRSACAVRCPRLRANRGDVQLRTVPAESYAHLRTSASGTHHRLSALRIPIRREA